MKAFIFLFVTVGCSGMQWKTINEFRGTFYDYNEATEKINTSVKKLLETSKNESTLFLRNIYEHPTMKKIENLQFSEDKCYSKFINKDKFELSFQMQEYQLEIPLLHRVIDIRERLNDINSTISIYQGLADSRFFRCQGFNGNCTEETNSWLEPMVYNLYCKMYSDCKNHSVSKRSQCQPGEFTCGSGGCIAENYFCDGGCNCFNDCTDEPLGCVRDCTEFRCRETFRCVSLAKKCNGNDDCGDGSDEEECSVIFTHNNCSAETGELLCDNNKCIGLDRVCDGHSDCDDGTDESEGCRDKRCSPDCSRKGGFCLSGPQGPQCLYECPPGTFETSDGCSTRPVAPPATLAQAIDQIPQLTSRFTVRMNYLKSKTIFELLKSIFEVVKCKRNEFTLLSRVMAYSPKLQLGNAIAPLPAIFNKSTERKSVILEENGPSATTELSITTNTDDY